MLSLIVAMANHRVIGKDGEMPWHLPADLAWFKRNTRGKPVIMGRKTWDSIGRALPERINIVVSRDRAFHPDGAVVVDSPEKALQAAAAGQEIMVIGGAEMYKHFLPMADRLYLTLIDADLAGDVFFPDYAFMDWREVERSIHRADARNAYSCSFLILERNS